MPETTTSAVREVGQVADTGGRMLHVGVDHGIVRLSGVHGVWSLDATRREHFQRLFQQAEFAAEAWAKEHTGAGDA